MCAWGCVAVMVSCHSPFHFSIATSIYFGAHRWRSGVGVWWECSVCALLISFLHSMYNCMASAVVSSLLPAAWALLGSPPGSWRQMELFSLATLRVAIKDLTAFGKMKLMIIIVKPVCSSPTCLMESQILWGAIKAFLFFRPHIHDGFVCRNGFRSLQIKHFPRNLVKFSNVLKVDLPKLTLSKNV